MATGGKDAKIVVWEIGVETNLHADSLRFDSSSSSPARPNQGKREPNALTQVPVPTEKPNKENGNATENVETVGGVTVTGPSVFKGRPARVYLGHTGDVTSLSWSKSLFLASGSIDKTCRIWHISSDVCLCVLKHPDLVAGVDFHPLDDSLIMTGCFDTHLRFWDVATGVVSQRVSCASRVTACRFNQSGDFAVAGLYIGHIVFFQMAPFGYGKPVTSGMRYYTQIETRNKTGVEKKGRKVTSLRFVTVGEKLDSANRVQEYMLVTTNESRSRLYSMDDFSLVRRYRGANNSSMLQIGATCSTDGRHIISGSDDRSVVVWRLKNDLVKARLYGQGKRDMCDTYEAFVGSTAGPVTVAAFAPEHFVKARKALLTTGFLPLKTSNGVSGSAGADGALTQDEDSPHRLIVEASTPDSSQVDTLTAPSAEDAVGLSGALIVTAGCNGVIGVFEVTA